MEFQIKPTLTNLDLSQSTRIVVVLPPDPGLSELTKKSPNIQFVAIGIEGLEPAANLSLIGSQGFHPDQQAFIAGYLAAILTDDWRVGILLPTGNPSRQVEENAFFNGVRFFCGLCRPAHPPYVSYPQVSEISTLSDPTGWQSSVDSLIKNGVTTVYINPEASATDLFMYLFKLKINMIGGQTPPEALRSQWIATILPDPTSALNQIWPDLIAGKGGAQVPMPLKLTDTSSGLLNPARQRLVDVTMDNLVNGFIQPNPVPEP
jgi:hypothetical protein